MPSRGATRGRHRAPARFSNLIKQFALIALGLGAIFAIGYVAVGALVVPRAVGTVVTPPQSSFAAPQQYPDLSPVTNSDDKNCGDFFDQDDVQKYFIAQGGPTADPDNLDLDDDGTACENYIYSTNTPPSAKGNELDDRQS